MMFEREFEFTVHHPLEVCERRLLDMNKTGCLPIYPVSTDTVQHDNYTEIHIRQWPRQSGHGYPKISGNIRAVNISTCVVSGVASIHNARIGFVLLSILIFMMIGYAFYLWEIWFVALISMGYLVMVLQYISARNRIIRRLKKALNQPKKKKV